MARQLVFNPISGVFDYSDNGGSGGVFQWNFVNGTYQVLAPNNGYVPFNSSLTTFALPTVCPAGTVIRIAGFGTGLWELTQGINQQIAVGMKETTEGITGYLESTDVGDQVELLCIQANSVWLTLTSMGNITVH